MKKTSKALAELIISSLQEAEDKERQEDVQRYFRYTLKKVLGTGLTTVHKIVKKLSPEFANLRHDELIKIADILLKTEIHEVQLAAVDMLYLSKERLNVQQTFRHIEKWILAGQLSNWASIDMMNNHLTAYLVEQDVSLADDTVAWALSPNSWLRRAAAVTYVLPARDGRFLDKVYEIAGKLLNDEDEYVAKGSGWVLREAGKTDKKGLTEFINIHGKAMSRITLRYALEKFPPEERLEILNRTKC